MNESIETEDMHKWLSIGVASLLYFVQCNWTGPQVNGEVEWLKVKRKDAVKDLSLHDECNTNVKMPELLYFSKIIFSNKLLQNTHESCIWWLLRVKLLHQFILNENSGVLYEEADELITKINNLPLLKHDYCKTLFYIEAAQFYFYYRRIQQSEKYLELAVEAAKLNLKLEGVLGKRTKYQQEDKAQLFLKIDTEDNQFPSRDCKDLPKSLELNDDVRLDHIKFAENIKNVQLGTIEEAIILAK